MNTEKSIQKRSLNPVFDIENVGTENFYFEITKKRGSCIHILYDLQDGKFSELGKKSVTL